jgi:Na+-translocating ferredoxin:NAD+ oxidoreductase RnfD subunit
MKLGAHRALLFQIVALSFYAYIGLSFLGIKRHLFHLPLILGSAILIDQGLYWMRWRTFRQPFSAAITGLSLFILLESRSLMVFLVAVSAALFSKILFKTKSSHVFNPACFGVVFATSLFPHRVAANAAQWGAEDLLILLVFFIGLSVVIAARRVPIAVGYLVSFLALSFGRSIADSSHLLFYSGTAMGMAGVIFYCHMLTDPKTTPSNPYQQFFFGLLVGGLDVLGRMLFFVYAPFIALALTCAIYNPAKELLGQLKLTKSH